MSDIVKVSWSGGKDSTCAVLIHAQIGHQIKFVNYIPMLTEDIPLISKQHHEFILNTAEYFENLGAQKFFAKGMTYFDFVLHKCEKGDRKGQIYGFPCFIAGMCNFRDYSKVTALNNIDVGYYDYQDIGIAFDEASRQNQLNKEHRSILVEKEITEAMAKDICLLHGVLSPHYESNRRDGCVLCPNAKPEEREKWFAEYPGAYEIVEYLQERVMQEYPEDVPRRYPLRDKKWFIEPKGVYT